MAKWLDLLCNHYDYSPAHPSGTQQLSVQRLQALPACRWSVHVPTGSRAPSFPLYTPPGGGQAGVNWPFVVRFWCCRLSYHTLGNSGLYTLGGLQGVVGTGWQGFGPWPELVLGGEAGGGEGGWLH